MSHTATSMPSTDVPLMSPATLIAPLQLFLQLAQQLQGLDGTQLVHVHTANALGDLPVYRLEQLDLQARTGRGRQLFGDCVLGSLMQRENARGHARSRSAASPASRATSMP